MTKEISITQLVKANYCSFSHLRKGFAYYIITDPEESQEYIFPVPLEDLGDATIRNTEKAIYLMRYIRKSQEDGSFVKN